MHVSALNIGRAFFEQYLSADPEVSVLDVGGMDVNGSLRSVAGAGWRFLSVDLVEGPGVDVVLDDPYRFPFPDDSFDAIVSTSCFEHDSFFWLTFIEMCRVTRIGGYVYISAPSNGSYHRYPLDCWRFYPDAGLALAQWAERCGQKMVLCESFVAKTQANDGWNDFVCVFRKGSDPEPSIVPLHETVDCENVQPGGGKDVLRFTAELQYQRELSALQKALDSSQGK